MSDIRLQIKEKINIVDFLEEEGVKLTYKGKAYKGLCPFHTEKTPSFTVSEEFQNYKCFGCGESGDIFSYVIKKYGLQFKQALAFLADKAGIPYEIDNQTFVNLTRLYDLVATVEEIYKKAYRELPEFHVAKKDIASRGLKVDSDDFGYASQTKGELRRQLKEKGFTDAELEDSGLFPDGDPDWNLFSGRLVFFIRNYMGRTIGFSGRGYSERGPKYINSRDSTIYKKNKALYNIESAKASIRATKKVYVVEGLFDVIAMKSKGYENVVAACGTAITQDHVRQLNQYTGDGEIVLLLDGDKSGKKAARRAFVNFEKIQENGKIIILPNDLDPCDYLMKNSVLPEEQHLIDYFIELSKLIIFKENVTTVNKIRAINELFVESIVSDIIYDETVKKLSILLEIVEWPSKRASKVTVKKFTEERKSYPWNMLALAFWLKNRHALGREILKEGDYKRNLWTFINLLRDHYDDEKILPEAFGEYSKAVEDLINADTYYLEEPKVAQSHYRMLIRQYKKSLIKQRNMELRKKLHSNYKNGGD